MICTKYNYNLYVYVFHVFINKNNLSQEQGFNYTNKNFRK